jgi:hypothetical protein
MKRCETCAHWERSKSNPKPDRALCLAKKLDSFGDPDGAYISGVPNAFLSTGPKFGCVHHTAAGVGASDHQTFSGKSPEQS